MEAFGSYNNQINGLFSPQLDSPIVSSVLRLVLILYGALAAPHLPDQVLKWFDNVPFRLLILFLIVYTANKDPATALLIAVAFFVSVNTLAGKKPFEKFQL